MRTEGFIVPIRTLAGPGKEKRTLRVGIEFNHLLLSIPNLRHKYGRNDLAYATIILALFRTAAGLILTAFGFYTSVCLHTDKEGELQDRIEELWMSIDDRKKAIGSLTAAIFNKVAAFVTSLFNRVLGQRLFSIQMLGVSTSFAFAALFLLAGVIVTVLSRLLRQLPTQPNNLPPNFGESLSLVSTFCLIVGAMLFVVATLPAIWPSRFSRLVSLLPICLFVSGTTRLMGKHQLFSGQLTELASLLISVFTDVVLLAAVRKSVRWMSEANNPLRICLVSLLQIGFVSFVVWMPIEVAADLQVKYGWKLLPMFLFAVGFFNVFTGLAALTFVFILLLLLLQRAFWPAIEVTIYQVARFKLVRNHKAMAILGASGLVLAFPSIRGVVFAILSWLLAVFSGEEPKNSEAPK